MKAKIIDEGSDSDVENRINDFIENPDNKVEKVVDIKFSSAYTDRLGILYSALIMYEEA